MTDNMLMAVVGATGRTGVPLVQQALARGHRVRVLVRDPAKADRLLPDGIEVVAGDATDPGALSRLVADADVVVDVSGPTKGGAPGYRERSTRALLTALEGSAARLIHLTGAGVRAADDQPKVADRVVRGLMQVVARALLADSTAAVEALRTGGRPHLVVRGPRLTDGEPSGRYAAAAAVGRDSGIQITRADLATALLDYAEAADWPAGAPVVSAA